MRISVARRVLKLNFEVKDQGLLLTPNADTLQDTSLGELRAGLANLQLKLSKTSEKKPSLGSRLMYPTNP